MKARKKYELPDWAKIPRARFDIAKLKAEVLRLNNMWMGVEKANEGLFSLHERLTEKTPVYSFDQIPLTWHQPENPTTREDGRLAKEGRDAQVLLQAAKSSVDLHRLKTKNRGHLPSALNEHNWIHPLPYYKDSYIEKALKAGFKSRPFRVRLTRIKKGWDLAPHIDYGPDYAIRVIVPIQGAEGCVNQVERRGKTTKFCLKADGSAYFLNVGLRHSVKHRGPKDRVSLMFSLPDQRDIEGITMDGQPK